MRIIGSVRKLLIVPIIVRDDWWCSRMVLTHFLFGVSNFFSHFEKRVFIFSTLVSSQWDRMCCRRRFQYSFRLVSLQLRLYSSDVESCMYFRLASLMFFKEVKITVLLHAFPLNGCISILSSYQTLYKTLVKGMRKIDEYILYYYKNRIKFRKRFSFVWLSDNQYKLSDTCFGLLINVIEPIVN